jgi:hypothetical protein
MQYGMGTSHLSWDNLKSLNWSTNSIKLKRNPEVQCNYDNLKKMMRDGLDAHIEKKAFGEVVVKQAPIVFRKDKKGKLIAVPQELPKEPENADRKDVAILDNDFPYDLQYDIIHLVVWLRPGVSYREEGMKSIFDLYMKDYVCFKNDPEIQSVKSIPHYHLFLKNKQEAANMKGMRFQF